jgi:hypothetical protein
MYESLGVFGPLFTFCTASRCKTMKNSVRGPQNELPGPFLVGPLAFDQTDDTYAHAVERLRVDVVKVGEEEGEGPQTPENKD